MDGRGREADHAAIAAAAAAAADSPFLKTFDPSVGRTPRNAPVELARARSLPLLGVRAANGGCDHGAGRPIRALPREVRRIADGNDDEYPPE